jgi:hypothetical protein
MNCGACFSFTFGFKSKKSRITEISNVLARLCNCPFISLYFLKTLFGLVLGINGTLSATAFRPANSFEGTDEPRLRGGGRRYQLP